MDAIKSRDPCKNSEASNSMEEATAAETIGTSQHQQQKGDPQQQYQHKQGRKQHNMNGNNSLVFAEIRQKVTRSAKNS